MTCKKGRGGEAGIPLAMPPLRTRCCRPWRSHVLCHRLIVAFALATWAGGVGGSPDEESGQPEVRILSPAHGSSHCSAGEVGKRHDLSASGMSCVARWHAGGRFERTAHALGSETAKLIFRSCWMWRCERSRWGKTPGAQWCTSTRITAASAARRASGSPPVCGRTESRKGGQGLAFPADRSGWTVEELKEPRTPSEESRDSRVD